MPTYEYECKSCSHGFEVFQSMSDPPLKDCPKCGREVRRLIVGGAGVIFKGSGFYVTDKGKADKPSVSKKPDGGTAGDSVSKAGATGSDVQKSDSAKGDQAQSSSEKAKPETKSA
jgi:putative FmdB family regulatory protein